MRFVVYALAAWRLAHMIVHEDGPFRAFRRLREEIDLRSYGSEEEREGGMGFPEWVSDGIHCVSCVSVWSAAGLLLAPRGILLLLAGSGAAKLVEDYFYGGGAAEDDDGIVVTSKRIVSLSSPDASTPTPTLPTMPPRTDAATDVRVAG